MYPHVKGEFDTVHSLREGKSIARFGDGELKILDGKGYSREPVNLALTAEMRRVVRNPHPDCLVAIPTMNPAGPKYKSWLRHEARFINYFRRKDGRQYHSAFITRPDSAADRLESGEYFHLISGIWAKRERVVVVSEPSSKLLTCARATSGPGMVHVECPSYQAYAVIDFLEEQVIAERPSVVLISCGPTATCLANRLSARGIQALDLGSIGGLLMRWMPKVELTKPQKERHETD